MKINQLLADMRNVDIRFRVIKKGQVKDVNLEEDKKIKLSEIEIGDETGRIVLTLWDQNIDLLNEGEIGEVKNGFIKVIRSELRLNVGKYGQLLKVEQDVDFVTLENIPKSFPKPLFNYKERPKKRFSR